MDPETFRLYLSKTGKCTLHRGSEKYSCSSTLEALERARQLLPKQRARMEVYDDQGQRFMVLPI